MNHDVFISYSKKDAKRLKPLREALTAAGIKYWIDDRIDGSENFLAEIPDAIRKCSIVLFVASQNSANSEWTQKELLYARNQRKEIFPYKLDDFKFENCAELDFFFTNIQWKESVNEVVAGLEKKLGVRAFESTPAPTPQPSPSPFKKFWWVAFVVLVSVIICFWVLRGYTYAKMKNIPDNDFVVYNAGRKMGYMQKSTNSIIVQAKYDYAIDFSEGLARVELYGKSGFIDKAGNEIIHLKYVEARNFSEGLAAVKLNDKWGYIDKTGKEVIPLKYDNVGYYFSEGLARVKLNGKWGFVDKSDRVVIPLKYDSVDYFSENKAKVTLNGEEFYIDKNGNRVE